MYSRRRHSPRRRSPSPGYHSRRHSPRRRPWSPPSNRSTGVGRPGKNLFVAGFSFVTTERDLEKKFSRFGRVTDVRIVRDKRCSLCALKFITTTQNFDWSCHASLVVIIFY